jgi:hypothetical protein
MNSKMKDLMLKYNVQFSGCQVFQQSNPFGLIRRHYGDVKVCVVRFGSTTLLFDKICTEYYSTIMRPIFNPDPNRIRVLIPKTEFIDGLEDDWESKVVQFIRETSENKLIVLEGVYWPEEQNIHSNRIKSILQKLDE